MLVAETPLLNRNALVVFPVAMTRDAAAIARRSLAFSRIATSGSSPTSADRGR
jgi:hypothetical protein